MFTVKNEKSYFTQEELDDIWSDIDNENDAIKCLNHFGRNIKYPYFVSGLIHVSLKRPHETYACNILEHSMVRLRNNQWVTVNLQREYYNGIIHKIDVEREQLYFANGVLTHC